MTARLHTTVRSCFQLYPPLEASTPRHAATLLARHDTVDTVLQACAHGQPLWTSCPRGGLVAGEVERFTEDEPAFGELALVCPGGQFDYALDWQHEKSVPLLRPAETKASNSSCRRTAT